MTLVGNKQQERNYNPLLCFLQEYVICVISLFLSLMHLSYLAEGCALCHDDMKLAFTCSVFEKGLDCARSANCHDDLIGVDVLQGLHGNVVCCSL